MDGILIIDKPSGLTSNDVCQYIKRALHCRRVGHTGTLDPLATGVLPILLNGATKWATQFANDEKEYYVTATFGVTTTTYDTEGAVVAEHPVPADLLERIEATLPQFRGALQQVPPPFSAVKFQGKPLYWWARKGRPVEVPARPIEVFAFDVQPLVPSHQPLQFRITCSKGTYVRSLIHDLGQIIGCGAQVSALRRVRAGRFTIDDAHPLAAVCGAMDPLRHFDKFLYKKSNRVVSP